MNEHAGGPPMINAFDVAKLGLLPEATQALIRRRQRVMGASYRLFYEEPVHLDRAEGVWLFDLEGTRYLDVYNNVPCVGHCHPRVVAAVREQVGRLNTHTRYLTDLVVDYAERLVATFSAGLSQVMLTCTGSEAIDLALRIARLTTGGLGVIVTGNAYHGVTAAAAEASPSLGAGVPLGPYVRTVRAPDSYRDNPATMGEEFAARVQAEIADFRRHGVAPAALLFDTVFSSDGLCTHPPGFILPAVAAIRAAGGLFIADEVQPGFARTGSAMWGFQRHRAEPDLVVLGKPMGNGMPVAGVVGRPALFDEFATRTRYFNTFGGNPVSCAAAMAVLDVLRDEALMQNAATVGAYLRAGLIDLARRFEQIGDVRGDGLFIALEFVRDRASQTPDGRLASSVVNAMRRRHVLISASGIHGNSLKIRPPLPFAIEHADLVLDALAASLEEVI
ncbi:aspartate aminotransferase family protein [Acidisoma sp.]|uniref:aspartate aminotransferase family protein n=1 Tax=Acidisoma sp. TaxID=1872115 RepID=UPI003B0087F2